MIDFVGIEGVGIGNTPIDIQRPQPWTPNRAGRCRIGRVKLPPTLDESGACAHVSKVPIRGTGLADVCLPHLFRRVKDFDGAVRLWTCSGKDNLASIGHWRKDEDGAVEAVAVYYLPAAYAAVLNSKRFGTPG